MMDKKKKIMTSLAVLSLGLNIFLLGIIAGHVANRFSQKDVKGIIEKLPPKKRKLFSRVVRKIHPRTCNTFPEMKQSRHKIYDILIAPRFNTQTFQYEVDKIHLLRLRMFKDRAQAIKKLASQFTQQERKVLVKYMKYEGRRFGGNKRIFSNKGLRNRR